MFSDCCICYCSLKYTVDIDISVIINLQSCMPLFMVHPLQESWNNAQNKPKCLFVEKTGSVDSKGIQDLNLSL